MQTDTMQLIGFILSVVVFIPALGRAEELIAPGNVGDTFEITRRYETSGRTADRRSASNSWGRDTLVERVVGVSEQGLELEYDLPANTLPEVRARAWQFPARVLKPASGPMRLLNPGDLKVRVEAWRRATGRAGDDCDRSSPFRFFCDPQSVIEMLEPFDLRPAGLRAGAMYQDSDARDPGVLEHKTKESPAEGLVVVMSVDPDDVWRERAEADVAAGEMMRKPVTLEAALSDRAKEQVSGTISVTFEIDAAGAVRKRRKVTRLEIKRPDGRSETKVATEIVETRRIFPQRAPPKPAG